MERNTTMGYNWKGRFDGEDELCHRIFQRVKKTGDFNFINDDTIVLQGFSVDEGVRRNHGRVGAAEAPDFVRKNLCNFPVIQSYFELLDFGNVTCEDQNLELAQNNLADNVTQILNKKGKSLVIGGGHEVTFAHYKGIKNAYPDKKIGIINFDAHFDNRQPENGQATSGTGFWQIAQEGAIHSLHIGIQKNSNTLKLFETADNFGMKYILAEELFYENLIQLYPEINRFIEQCDVLYVTICMDVFNAAIAPGVSAQAYNGIFVDTTFLNIYRHILSSHKLKALDIAEVNPTYDIQERTARLAASLINEWFMI